MWWNPIKFIQINLYRIRNWINRIKKISDTLVPIGTEVNDVEHVLFGDLIKVMMLHVPISLP